MTAIVPCAIAALFGSSRHVVSGPTNANSLALFATLGPLALVGSQPYIELALAVTVIVGVMQLAIGALRLGAIANFISPAALRGFMSGAAALIALHSLTDLLGLSAPTTHGLMTLFEHIGRHLGDIAPAAFGVGLFTIAVALGLRAALPRWPYMLIGLVAGTALATGLNYWVFHSPSDRHWIAVVGKIPTIVPEFHLPDISLRSIPDLVGISFALTIVALGQSISIAKAVAERSGQHIDANREFRGQGLSNIVGGLCLSYVSCGSLNRSMPNYEAGARTPLAAVFASLLLLVLIARARRCSHSFPMAAIAGLLLLSLLDAARLAELAAPLALEPERLRHRRGDFLSPPSASASSWRSCSAPSCRSSCISIAPRSRRCASWASTRPTRGATSSSAKAWPHRSANARS